MLEAVRHIPRGKNGPVDIYTATEKDNLPTRRLFEKLDFSPDGRPAMKEKYGLKRFYTLFPHDAYAQGGALRQV